MYNGDRMRKSTLVNYGFRLPSALDNRPLTFSEFERHVNQAIYVSATPSDYEVNRSSSQIEQIIRPTGLLDPVIEVRPIEGQIDNLIEEIRTNINKRQRVLVTTLTKRMAEDLTEYLEDLNIKGMMKLWGKKVSDLSFSSFVLKLEYVSIKYGTVIHKIDRWYASSNTCGDCGTKNTKLKLSDR